MFDFRVDPKGSSPRKEYQSSPSVVIIKNMTQKAFAEDVDDT